MSFIETPPVSLIVRPAFSPRSMQKVPRVMMKLGSFVFTTAMPLTNPTARPKARQTRIAGQMFQPCSVVRMPSNRPELPIMTPAERSNSPPIIRSATGTATMPSYAAVFSQLAQILRSVAQLTSRAVIAKRTQTATAPTNAPLSGRLRSRAKTPTRARRSSEGGAEAGAGAVVVISFSRSSSQWYAREGAGGQEYRPTHPRRALACALLCKSRDLRRVGFVHDPRPGQHRLSVPDRVQVVHEQVGEYDRQVALEVLLLVDCKQELA